MTEKRKHADYLLWLIINSVQKAIVGHGESLEGQGEKKFSCIICYLLVKYLKKSLGGRNAGASFKVQKL